MPYAKLSFEHSRRAWPQPRLAPGLEVEKQSNAYALFAPSMAGSIKQARCKSFGDSRVVMENVMNSVHMAMTKGVRTPRVVCASSVSRGNRCAC